MKKTLVSVTDCYCVQYHNVLDICRVDAMLELSNSSTKYPFKKSVYFYQ